MKQNTFAWLAGLIAGGLLAVSTQAQTPAEKKPGVKPNAAAARSPLRDQSDLLAQRLNLTPGQKAKVKVILDEQEKKIGEANTATQDKSVEELRTKLVKIREEARAKMKEVLTPEQWEKYTRPARLRPRSGAHTNAAPAK